MLGGRVSKATKRSLKGKSTELMIQNVWNRQNLAEEYEKSFLVLRLFDAARSWFPYEKLKSFNVHRVGLP